MGWGDRLCVMNLFLHGIGGDDSPIMVGDALISDPGDRFEFVLTNPPFGKKSSITIFNGERKVRQTKNLSYMRGRIFGQLLQINNLRKNTFKNKRRGGYRNSR
jgi:type I restriction-modification system DNA methylase subunit